MRRQIELTVPMMLRFFTLSAVFAIFAVPTCAERPPSLPNVLMIAIDDLNDWVEPLGGHPQVKTPALKALAERGVVFTNAHCQSPLCNPSRTSVLTSLRPSTTGIYGLAPWFRDLADYGETITLPQFLEDHGYETYCCGKIYHGWQAQHKPGHRREFMHWGPGSGPGKMPKKKLVGETPNGNNPWVDWGLFGEDADRADSTCAEWTERTLTNMRTDKPFFLAVGFFSPHVPCYVSQKWWDMYPEKSLKLPQVLEDDLNDVPPFSEYLHWRLPEPKLEWLRERKQHKNLVRSYLAATSYVDNQVHRVLKALEASRFKDETLIVLWSDHGYHLGEKGMTGKTTLWSRSTRVPLIFAGPGIQPGVCHEPAELLDIFPTLADMIGVESPSHLEGQSLVAQLNRPRAHRTRPAVTTHNPGNFSVHGRRYHLIHYANGSEELYDLETDKAEYWNRIDAPELKDVANELRTWVPTTFSELAKGSEHRVLEQRGDRWYWEGSLIGQ